MRNNRESPMWLISTGYNTIQLRRELFDFEAVNILAAFQDYEATGAIEITKDLFGYVITYKEYKGLEWTLYPSHIIEAEIKPRIFIDTHNSVMAKGEDIRKIEFAFDAEVKKISDSLGCFSAYDPFHIVYAGYFAQNEFEICTPQQMLQLISRANLSITYLSDCYDRLADKDWNAIKTYNSPDNSGILFEIKHDQKQILSLLQIAPDTLFNSDLKYHFLSDFASMWVIREYLYKIVTGGDYYTFSGAVEKIKSRFLDEEDETQMIEILTLIDKHQGIYNAKTTLNNNDFHNFAKGIRNLIWVGINPVVIPNEWNIDYIPNLLNSYFRHPQLLYRMNYDAGTSAHLYLTLESVKKGEAKK